jgi:hypothetical protein
MTTTVTLKTHDWPVDVETVDSYERVYHSVTETVPPHTERQFVIHSTRDIRFTELPLVSIGGAEAEAGKTEF